MFDTIGRNAGIPVTRTLAKTNRLYWEGKKTKFAQREASWDAAIKRRHDRVQGTNRDESRGTDGLFSRTIDIMRPAQGTLGVADKYEHPIADDGETKNTDSETRNTPIDV